MADAQQRQHEEELRIAASNGDVKAVKRLLALAVGDDESTCTALLLGAEEGHVALVEALLEAGVKVEAADSTGYTALMAAAHEDHVAVLDVLLKAGANVEAADNDGNTALSFAAELGNLAAFEALCQAGADVEAAAASDGATALVCAAERGHRALVEVLLKSGANVEAADSDGATVLLLAAERGHLAVVSALLESGANVEAADGDGVTALVLAAEQGHVAVAEVLIKAGANVDTADKRGDTALSYAAGEGRGAVVKVLIDAGANVNHTSTFGTTALMIASRHAYAGVVAELLKAGADMELVDPRGGTALHDCARGTDEGLYYGSTLLTVEALVSCSARLDAVNAGGLMPLEMARKGATDGDKMQRARCREMAKVLEVVEHMSVGLRKWLKAAGLEGQWREFARLGAKEKEDLLLLTRDDVRPDRGSALTPIEANRLFRALAMAALPKPIGMGALCEEFLRANALEGYSRQFRQLGAAFERDLLDVTGAQLAALQEREGLKVLDRRRFDKAVVVLRRRLEKAEDLAGEEDLKEGDPRRGNRGDDDGDGGGSAELPPVRVKREGTAAWWGSWR